MKSPLSSGSFLLLIAGAFLHFFAGVSAGASCAAPSDTMKTSVVELDFTIDDGSKIKAKLLCSEDPAMAAARIAFNKKTKMEDGEKVLELAKALEEKLGEEASEYKMPDELDAGTPEARPRVLKSGGQYSRRAGDHAKKGQYETAVADFLRALIRPGIDPTARDRLMATMRDALKKAEKKREASKQDGDLSDLFDSLELEDDGKSNVEIEESTLKRVYRQLSIKYHPDKNPDAAARFNKIRDAYEVLSDPVKTLLYDTGGMEIVRKYEKNDGEIERTPNEDHSFSVTLEDIYKGSTRKLSTSRRVVCRSCRLNPSLPRCNRCEACPSTEFEIRRKWINQHQFMQEQHPIPSKEKCMRENRMLDVVIERGMLGGDKIVNRNQASQLPKQIPGDISITVNLRKHQMFERLGNNLVVTIRISLAEALLGFERELVHLDGHVVKFGTERGTVIKPSTVMAIEDEGMPLREDSSSFGKLFVKFEIEFPTGNHIDEKAGAVLKEALAKAQSVASTQTKVHQTMPKSFKPPKKDEL